MKNLFITFEGIDGCGKDTQVFKLAEAIKLNLSDKYANIWLTREPTNITKEGIEISKKIKKKISGVEASKLFIKDRQKHSKIISFYLKTSFVLCSRYDISTLSYQMVQGVDFETLYNMHEYKKETLIPDITIIFDLKVCEALNRVKKRDKKLEFFEEENFQNKVKENINFCISELKKRQNKRIFIRIDASQNIEEVTRNLVEKLKKFF